METLVLTASEKELFDDVSEALRRPWKIVVEEVEDAYETPKQLEMRMRIVTCDQHPEVAAWIRRVVEDLGKNGRVDAKTCAALPTESLPVVCFGMGVLGMSALIEAMLSNVKDAAMLEGIAALTVLRSCLVEANRKTNAKYPTVFHG